MSLTKEACAKCWLPPLKGSSLCRPCRGKEEPSVIERIRYHKDTDCKLFRKLLHTTEYYGNCVPEECLSCSFYIIKLPEAQRGWKTHFLYFYLMQSCDTLSRNFQTWYVKNRGLTLDFIRELLIYFREDYVMTRKIVRSLINIADNTEWMLIELIFAPCNFSHAFVKERVMPYPFTYNFWSSLPEFENIETFLTKAHEHARRKVKFRTLSFKEELMQKTWHPDRFIEWCIDEEERNDLGVDWFANT